MHQLEQAVLLASHQNNKLQHTGAHAVQSKHPRHKYPATPCTNRPVKWYSSWHNSPDVQQSTCLSMLQ